MILLASGNYLNSMLELITVLLIFLFVLALTYYVTRWIARGNLSVIEAIRVANNQYIQILRAGTDKYLVVGIGKDRITLLATLSEEELREMPGVSDSAARSGESFSDLLEAVKKKLPKK